MISEIQNRAVAAGGAPSGASIEVVQEEGYITKKEVAGRLKKTTRTVENWQRRGYIPVVRIGRSVLYRWSDVVGHLQGNFRDCRFDG